jgi:hypothetical protein
VFSTSDAIETLCRRADLVIASVLIPGAAAPKLITAETVKAMKSGSVIVDIAIDQGGCAETSRPTTHSAPTYIVDDVVHYCVTNMPGAVARTSTFALNNVTLLFVLALADKGYRRALGEDPHLRNGLNVYEGKITHRAVADALKLKFTPPEAPCGFDRPERSGRADTRKRRWSQLAIHHQCIDQSQRGCSKASGNRPTMWKPQLCHSRTARSLLPMTKLNCIARNPSAPARSSECAHIARAMPRPVADGATI